MGGVGGWLGSWCKSVCGGGFCRDKGSGGAVEGVKRVKYVQRVKCVNCIAVE